MPSAAGLDAAAWGALALGLTLVGAVATVFVWRRRGVAAGLRAAAWTLVPLALWLTGTLGLVFRIVEYVVWWALHLVFSPVVWLGIMVALTSAALFVASRLLRRRRPGSPERRKAAGTASRPALGKGIDSGVDAEMAEIEAILKRHGI